MLLFIIVNLLLCHNITFTECITRFIFVYCIHNNITDAALFMNKIVLVYIFVIFIKDNNFLCAFGFKVIRVITIYKENVNFLFLSRTSDSTFLLYIFNIHRFKLSEVKSTNAEFLLCCSLCKLKCFTYYFVFN